MEEDDINNSTTKEVPTDITTFTAPRQPVGGDASGGQQAQQLRRPSHYHSISVLHPPGSLPVGGETSGGNQAHTPETPQPHTDPGTGQTRIQVGQSTPPKGINPGRWQKILAQLSSKHAREEKERARINYSWDFFKLEDKQRMQEYGARFGPLPERRAHLEDIQE